MNGPFGGRLERGDDDGYGTGDATRELLPPRLVVPTDSPARALPARAGDVELLVVHAHGEGVVLYDQRIDGWTAFLEGAEPLTALARVGEAIVALHADGIVHGDLGPRFVGWRLSEGAAPVLSLLTLAAKSSGDAARALVLGNLEPWAYIGYVAPEVLGGAEWSFAADVYALAAMVHRALSGVPPLGQVEDFAAARGGPLETLAQLLRAALSADPTHRPSAAILATELRAVAEAYVPGARVGPGAATSAYRAGERAGGRPLAAPARAVPSSSSPATGLVTPVQREALRADTAQMSTLLVVLLLLGGAFVFFGAIWLVTTNWSALGEVGHFALLLALTLGAGVGGWVAERRGYGGSGLTLGLLASRLLWADAAYVLDITGEGLHGAGSGSWCVAAACVAGGAALLSLVKRQSLYAWMMAIDLAILAVCLGDFLSTGRDVGPTVYAALVAVAFAVVAFGASFVPARDQGSLGLPFAVFAAVATWIAAVAALVLLGAGTAELFAALAPYALIAASGFVAWRAPGVYRVCALVALLPLLLLAPSVEALIRHDSLVYLLVTLAVGVAVLGSLVAAPANDLRDLARAAVGITNVGAASSLLFVTECAEVPGDEVIGGPLARYFFSWALGALGLVVFGYLASGRSVTKPTYRTVEMTGLLQLFGLATFVSLFRGSEVFYPALIFGTGVMALGVGLVTRRATLVLAAAVTLLTNLSIQYFLRLQHLLPTAVLIIGFGVVLLGLGLLYERKLRKLLPLLRAWN